ncbi:hypothetical protein DFH28DRAFT_926346 [Melampsora americana]|nr:hypothetical protein DFH28DRAFT_926346 [Melampsora americana]
MKQVALILPVLPQFLAMSLHEKKIVNFVLHLPPKVHPYRVRAQHVKGVMTLPQLANWETMAQHHSTSLFVILFMQSALVDFRFLHADTQSRCKAISWHSEIVTEEYIAKG